MQMEEQVRAARNNPAYRCWWGMLNRVKNPNNKDYHRYGGRGIKVDPRWINFWEFLNDVGERPSPQHSLDRIDNDGNYEPGNVRWATRQEQTHNSRVVKVNRAFVEEIRELYWGKYVITQADLGRRYGLSQSTVSRILSNKIWR